MRKELSAKPDSSLNVIRCGDISAEKLEKKLLKLQKKGFVFINPKDLEKTDLPPRPALLTFAEGYESFYKNIFPLLAELKIPALVFVTVSAIGSCDFWNEDGLWHNILSAAQIKELKKSGLVDFGSAGLTGKTPPTAQEIEESAHRLKTLHKINPLYFCFCAAEEAGRQDIFDAAKKSFRFLFTPDGKLP